MSARHPSRIALAVFDYFISNNDPLKGDLIEEFHVRPSQLWLWRQVLWAVACRPWPQGVSPRGEMQLSVLAAAMLVLMAFEAVFVTNAIHRFLFGPPLQDIRGYVYLIPPMFHPLPATSVQPTPSWTWHVPVVAIVSSFPIGWFIARVRERHRALALAAFSVSITLCAAANLQIPLSVQFVTTTVFILGLLSGGTIEATVGAQSSA